MNGKFYIMKIATRKEKIGLRCCFADERFFQFIDDFVALSINKNHWKTENHAKCIELRKILWTLFENIKNMDFLSATFIIQHQYYDKYW